MVRRFYYLLNLCTPRYGWLLEDSLDSLSKSHEVLDKRLIDSVIPIIEKTNSPVVGISIIYPDQLEVGLRLAKNLKKRNEDLFLVLGGAQITAHINKIKETPAIIQFVDAMIVNEGEVGLRELLSALKSNRDFEDVANLYYNDGNKFNASKNVSFVTPMSEYRIPDFKDFNLDDYGHTLPVRILRGCYYNQCTFCTYPITGGKFAYTSADFAVDNMETLYKKHGITSFEIIDSSVPAKYMEDIAKLLIKRNLNFKWSCLANVQVQFLDQDLMKLLQKSGLIYVQLGVESGTERIVKLMKKMQGRQNNDTTTAVIKNFFDHGISPLIFNMFGFPTETKKEMQTSLKFIMELNRKYNTGVRFANPFNLEPATPVFQNPEAFGITSIGGPERGSQGYGYKYTVSKGASSEEVHAFCRIAQIFLRYPFFYKFRFLFGWKI